MICDFCNATMDERKIYGVFIKNDFIVTCSRCYPVKDKNQGTLSSYLAQKTDVKKLTIINKSRFETKDIEEITLGLLAGQLAPSFYLVCNDYNSVKGIALTNLDKPTIIIFIKDLGQFAETFVHELTHIQQHQDDYADEKEADEREIVVT